MSESREGIDHIIETVLLVRSFFGDDEKTRAWFTAANPLFGDFTAADLLSLGRTEMLLQVVKGQLAENAPPTSKACDVPGSFLAGTPCLYETAEECPNIDCSHNAKPVRR